MNNFTKFLKLSLTMFLVFFLCQNTYAQQIGLSCSGDHLVFPDDPGVSIYVLAAGDCAIIDVAEDGVYSPDDLLGDNCVYTISYADASTVDVSTALATGCVDDIIALGAANDDVTVTEFCGLTSCDGCEDFDVQYDIACSAIDGTGVRSFKVILSITGGDSGDNGYVITDDLTGESYGPMAGPVFISNEFVSGDTGFSYTVSVADNPSCALTVSASSVDCTTTEIELIRFNASAIETGNQLNWVTATESNAKFFIVEHSRNGVDFAQVGIITATGFSNVSQDYSFLHSNTSNGIHYYRLKEVDVDENIRIFTETITVNRIGGLTINHVYPVPTENMVNVDFSSSIGETVVVRVVDITGKVLDQQNYEAVGGMNNIAIDATPYAIGNYFITISNGSTTVVEKFVKN